MSDKETKQKQQLSYFEKQRDGLISEIAISMDSVLNNINALNRSLESTIAVGREFDSVANLWSHFYDGLAQLEQLKNFESGSMTGYSEKPQGEEDIPESQQTEVDQTQVETTTPLQN